MDALAAVEPVEGPRRTPPSTSTPRQPGLDALPALLVLLAVAPAARLRGPR